MTNTWTSFLNKLRFLFLFLISLNIGFSKADEYHYNNLLIGKNAVGLGGAFAAVADDLSTIHYNPAGLSNVKSGNMASINTFSWEQTKFFSVFGNGADFERNAFSIVPGFFGVKGELGDWHTAAALIVKDYGQERSDDEVFYQIPAFDEGLGQNIQEFATIDIDNSAYEIIFAGAKKVSNGLSLGVSLGIEYKSFLTDQSSGTVIENLIAPNISVNTGFEATARFSDVNWLLNPSLSIFYQTDNINIGAKITQPININRVHSFTSSIIVSGVDPTTPGVVTSFRDREEACCKQDLPLQITLGTSYKIGSLQISADINYFGEEDQKLEFLPIFKAPITRKLEEVTNASLGLSYAFSNYQNLRVGIFTDNANSKPDPAIPYQRTESIDLLGVSIAYETKVFDFPVSFGTYYKWGDGQIRIGDLRAVEEITGLALYPDNNDNDISEGEKQSLVVYFSLDF